MPYIQLVTIVAAVFLMIFSVLSRRAKAKQYAVLRAELARSSELVRSIREAIGSTEEIGSTASLVLIPIEKQLQDTFDANARLKGGLEAWMTPIEVYASHASHKQKHAYWTIFASTYPALDRRKPTRDFYRALSAFPHQVSDPDAWYEDSDYHGSGLIPKRQVTLH